MRNRIHSLGPLRQRGFTIVEAMVALLVLSVGMLGIAGLYVTTLRASGSALFRTHAVNFAADMADRIRANPTAGIAYGGAAADNNCAADPGAAASNCSTTQLAADDVFRWQQQIAAILPDDGDVNTPQGTVTVVGANPSTYTITVSWVEPTEPVALSYQLVMQI